MIVIQPVTWEQVNKLNSYLASGGNVVTPLAKNSYEISGQGVLATAVFDETVGSLSVTVVKKPFLFPLSVVEIKIREGIESALKG